MNKVQMRGVRSMIAWRQKANPAMVSDASRQQYISALYPPLLPPLSYHLPLAAVCSKASLAKFKLKILFKLIYIHFTLIDDLQVKLEAQL